ncbi:hypothetical protein [Candidatus Clostridium stratigraminis]|uniref:Uncharacterized protein n=1 Tax=Candidatus Clostridium stratigraminis TaxID=3381661 RepID=A0ABW8T054_9CLOT
MSKIVSSKVQEFINENLNDEFFKNNIPSQVSAYSIIDITTTVDGMDEEIYRNLPKEKKLEIKAENKVAEEEEDIDKLYNLLRKGLNPSTVNIITIKLMKHEKVIIPRLLENIKKSANESFVEAAARIFIKSENNYSKEVCEILPAIKYPYTQAVFCYILGKIGSEEHIETLYNYFNIFKRNYVNETYFEGPLVGLYEMKRRYEFSK